MTKLAHSLALAAAAVLAFGSAGAEDVVGKPIPGGTGFQPAVTPVMRDLVWLDDFLLVIITAIVLFVLGLMAWVIYRYDAKRNAEPATFTHNATIEVVWTAVPIVILIAIAIPSLRLLFTQLEVPEPDLTIKATGNQWYWSYEYPSEELEFDGYMIGSASTFPPEGLFPDDYEPVYDWTLNEDTKKTLKAFGYEEDEWLLATDTRIVVPVDANVHVLVTGSDVIHAFAVPSFGVKIDTIPGRVNETWFRAEQTGTYFGQCSELCGIQHSYMPIVVEVVTQEEYDAWVGEMQSASADWVPVPEVNTNKFAQAE
ncbi:MAG: cytochrome c oxidase subunit II [Pseudomonadota bacterium]